MVKLACHLLHSTCFKNFSDIPIIINNSLPLPASLVAQLVKNLPAVQETPVQVLDREDPLEKGMATHSSILAWKIPWREDPGRL